MSKYIRRLSAPFVLVAALAFGACSGSDSKSDTSLAADTAPMPDLASWDAVRKQFALDPAWMHFASFFIASHPAPVRDAIPS